jgi:DNA-binding transcriptional MerR regulator
MYNIKMVSKLLDIPATTIRAWENRYHAVSPMRTKSGYRIYTEKDIADLRWLKEQSEEHAMSISQAVQLLSERKLNKLSAHSQAIVTLPFNPKLDFEQMTDQLYQHLTNFQLEEANRILELGFSMYRFDDLFHHVLAPLLHLVGEQWEKKQLTIAQEHFVTQFIIQRFHQFFRVFPVDAQLPKVLAFCPPGEHHQIGLLLFTLFLRQHAVEVIFLGPDTPIDGLNLIVVKKNISYVCVSLTNPNHLSACEEVLQQLSDDFPSLQFLLGGKGFNQYHSNEKQFLLGSTRENWESWFQKNMRF